MWVTKKNWIVFVIKRRLQEVKLERDFIKRYIAACKDSLQNSEIDLLSPRPSCSIEGTVHYSYDYTQQVQIPSNPKQPGPIFFKFLWSEACLRYVVRECRDRSMTSLTRQFLLAKGPMQPLAVCMTSSFLTGQGKLMHKLMQIIMRGTEDKQLFYLVLLLANSLWTAQIIIVFSSDYRAYKI